MSSLPSRRSACDRCKGQKLRCLRDPGEERCNRCTRANAECLTTATFRFRNASGDGTGNVSRKRPRHDGQQQSDLIPNSDQGINSFLSTYPVGNSDNTLSQGIFSSEENGSWGPSMYGLMSSDALDGNFSFFDTATNKVIRPTDDGSRVVSSPIPQSNHSPEGTLRSECHMNHWDNVVPFSPDGVIATQDQNDQLGSSIPGEVHVQRLSKMNLNLATILGRIGQGSPKVTLEFLVSPCNDYSATPIHSITDGTREFIDILRALLGATRRPTTSSSSEGPSPRSQGLESNGNGNISATSGDSFPNLQVYSLAAASTPPMLTSANEPATTLDATTLLLILTSYIHVTRLFLIIFAHTYECLREISKSDKPSLCAIPGIDFGKLPLHSGSLQAMMFIEVVNNLFERMEGLLGVPRQFRVGLRGAENDGLLSDEEIDKTLKMMMSKEELVYQPQYGKGGAKALRMYLDMTKQLLREKITP
ncbi:hypothetical protein F4781DRAFT_188887 [Annulohypoxylon bovei var. microspora]|nr:hypothetical protein F4781DRAFT_188887 [Annulohypoxylon bovei var. microspora]